MADESQAAKRGFRGFTELIKSQFGAGPNTNEFGFTDKMRIDIPQEGAAPASGAGSPSIRSREQAAENERLSQQGIPYAEIMRREAAKRR